MDELTEMNPRAEAEWYDETTISLTVYFDKTKNDDPSKLKFLLPDGTELKVERSEGVEQGNGEPVYEVTGVKKA
jgi:hypothetical protein